MTTANPFEPSNSAIQPAPSDIAAPLEFGRRLVVVLSMYVGYAMFMVLRMIPTVAGTSITNDSTLGVSTGDWGRILAMGTVGAVVGKFIGGFAADRWGGRLTFFAGLIVSAIGVAGFAASTSVRMFQLTFFVALMAKSAGWPAMTKIIEASFRPQEYGRVWGTLATSSRVGTLAATFVLGGLLGVLAWPSMLYLAAASGVLIAFGFLFTLKFATRPQHPANDETATVADKADDRHALHPLYGSSLAQAIGYFASSRQFWLLAGSLMGLTILWDFLLFVPLYLTQTLSLTEAAASKTASAFPFGSLLSVLAGGFVFDNLNRRSTAWLMGGLLSLAAGCILVFLLMPQMNLAGSRLTQLSMIVLFLFGMCVSPCYYIPMSVFSIEFGGPHSGFLISLLDALAFGVTALFYFYAGDIAEQSWILFLIVLLMVAVTSILTTLVFMLGEARRLRAFAPSVL